MNASASTLPIDGPSYLRLDAIDDGVERFAQVSRFVAGGKGPESTPYDEIRHVSRATAVRPLAGDDDLGISGSPEESVELPELRRDLLLQTLRHRHAPPRPLNLHSR